MQAYPIVTRLLSASSPVRARRQSWRLKGERSMATVAAAEAPRPRGPQAPSPAVIQSVAVLGLSAGSLSFLFALTSDHVNEPGLQAALMDWVTLPYILGGLVAWWRRPDSRFGILMIVAGFTMFLSNLAWTNVPRAAHDRTGMRPAAGRALPAPVPRVPTGRIERAFDRALVAVRVRDGARPGARRNAARRLRREQHARDHRRAARGRAAVAGTADRAERVRARWASRSSRFAGEANRAHRAARSSS